MTIDENAPGGKTGGAGDEQAAGRVVGAMVRRRPRDWRAVWEPMRAQARAAAQARRARVLAHPDLAEALTDRPVGYARPEQWNGYVPPDSDQVPVGGGYVHNDSSRRAALVDLCAEALRREQEGART